MSDKRIDEVGDSVSENADRIDKLEDLVNKQTFLISNLYGQLGMNMHGDCNLYDSQHKD